MRRFRAVFAAVCLVLLVALGVLVGRAVRSVAVEREMRHRVVAERVFDEMERALSDFLAREEERPFGQYAYTYTPPGQLGGSVAVTRSPLADPPALPFVLGHFQIDPDGSQHTPLRPRDDEEAASTWQPTPATLARIASIEQAVHGQWSNGAGAPRRAAWRRQLPGTTLDATDSAAAAPAPPQGGALSSAYDALQALNKGAEQRADRQAKRSLEYGVRLNDERSKVLQERAPGMAREEKERDDSPHPSALAAVDLPPMAGRVIDAGRMILYRTVVVDTRGFRQGLVLDVDELEAWLREQGLGAGSLGERATLAFSSPFASAPADTTGEFAFLHRFAEPFDDLGTRLTLRALPGSTSAGVVYLLSALLVAVAAVGMAALYRMVAVTVGFAERRSNFVAAVSHELKTPLTAIRMYGEMLRDGMVASEAKRDEYYRHITVESERLSRLINNVLEFARLENGTRELAVVGAPVGPALHEVAALLGPHAAQEGFTLVVEVAPELPPARFERDALTQILFNLVDNAVKYAREHEPRRITIRAEATAGQVHVAVRDHGPGVPARHLARIFEPFYRGEQELTRRGKGTGLGLALVRGLAERMGAHATGRNLRDGGFEVEVVLRAVPAAAA
jgi:signal transduction histidine kinase